MWLPRHFTAVTVGPRRLIQFRAITLGRIGTTQLVLLREIVIDLDVDLLTSPIVTQARRGLRDSIGIDIASISSTKPPDGRRIQTV
jgi:hypothetical protein